MLVELKNGETLNGHLVTCDTWMNLTLKEVVQTSPVCWSRAPPFSGLHIEEGYLNELEGWKANISLPRMATNSTDYRRCMLRAITYVVPFYALFQGVIGRLMAQYRSST